MKLRSTIGLLMATSALSACNPGDGANAVRSATSALTTNSAFAAISGQVSELEKVVAVAQSSASISALINPNENDVKMAGDVVSQIDNVIKSWDDYKSSMNPNLLAVKLSTAEWREAEAVVKILKEDLRPVVTKVVNGGSYDTKDFEFLAKKETLDLKISEKKAAIFEGATPTVISASTSSVTVETSATTNSEERVKTTDIANGEQTLTGGDSVSNTTRTATWTRTTTKNMEYDRTFTLKVQNVTTTVFSDGTMKTDKGAIRSVENKQTFDAKAQVSSEEMSNNITFTTDVQNTPTIVVTRGSDTVENVYVDRLVAEEQADTSILHKTFRKTTVTTTTPVTTTTTYPKITVYTYADGHTFTDDATDEVVTEVVDDIVVTENEELHTSSTEHVVANEVITNEVITSVTEADPVFVTEHDDVTAENTVGVIKTTTVTRNYTTTATIVTTTTTKTTPVTKQTWTDDRVELIRGETVTVVATEDTVVTDNWSKVMSETSVTVVAEEAAPIGSDHADMGTRTPGYNSDPASYRTSEFNGSNGGQNYKSAIKAEYAYSRGWTGKGSLITIADTGYDVDHNDLSSAVKHTYNTLTDVKTTGNGDASMNDSNGHGSHVLGLAAGRKNGTGTHGVAFDADVAVAKISEGVAFSFGRAKKAMAWSRDLGAVAISVSANYNTDSSFRNSVVDDGNGKFHSSHFFYGPHGYNGVTDEAPSYATALGTEQVFVNSAGNHGYDYVPGTGQMATATDANGNLILGGRMLIVGNWNLDSNQILGNKAGHMCAAFISGVCTDAKSTSDFYILAPGSALESASHSGGNEIMTGTSMSTPVVAGSLAILHQMWPHMKGENLVQLVTKTADKTIAGYHVNTHGSGLLDLDKATQPVGATGIPTSGRTDGSISSLSGGAAIGNINPGAFAALSNAIVLDEFERDFTVDLSQTQAVDTRPGSYVEGLAFGGGGYDAYSNLAGTNQNFVTPEYMGLSAGMKMNSNVSGDYTFNANYKAFEDEETSLNLGLGFLKETGKFLNNVQEGFMGVGENHTTQYASLNISHKFSDQVFGFGNYQIGTTDVEASKDFSLVTGFSSLISQSFNTGLGFKPAAGWTMGGTYSQPLHVMSGSMNYKVPTGRSVDGAVQFDSGSADASTKVLEHDFGLFLNYKVDQKFSMAAFGEMRVNVAGTDGNNQRSAGVKLNWTY